MCLCDYFINMLFLGRKTMESFITENEIPFPLKVLRTKLINERNKFQKQSGKKMKEMTR